MADQPWRYVDFQNANGDLKTLKVPAGTSDDEVRKVLEPQGSSLVQTSTTETPTTKPGILAPLNRAIDERVINPMVSGASDFFNIPNMKKEFFGTDEERKAAIQQDIDRLSVRNMPREFLRQGLDVAQTAGPVIAPGATLAGVGTQAGLEAAGASPEAARIGGTVMEIGAPLAKAGLAASEKGLAKYSKALKGETKATYGAESGKVSKAFEDITQDAFNQRLHLSPADPEYRELADHIDDLNRMVGPNLSTKKAKILANLRDDLASGQDIPYEDLEQYHRFLRTSMPDPKKLAYTDQYAAQQLEDTVGMIRKAQRATLEGTGMEHRLDAAMRDWATKVTPTRGDIMQPLERGRVSPETLARRASNLEEEGQGIPEVLDLTKQRGRVSAWRKPQSLAGLSGKQLVGGLIGGAYGGGPELASRIKEGTATKGDFGNALAYAVLGGLGGQYANTLMTAARVPGGKAALVQLGTLLAKHAGMNETPADPEAIGKAFLAQNP